MTQGRITLELVSEHREHKEMLSNGDFTPWFYTLSLSLMSAVVLSANIYCDCSWLYNSLEGLSLL